MTHKRRWNFFAITASCFLLITVNFGELSSVHGQTGGVPGTGLNTGGFNNTGNTGLGNTGLGNTGLNNTGLNNTGGFGGNGGGLGGNNAGLFGGGIDFGSNANQDTATGGFVGASRTNPEWVFIGPTAESVGSTAGGAGGGGGGGGIGGIGGGNRGAFGGDGGGGPGNLGVAGQANGGVTVTRARQVRTRVVPNFRPRPISTFQQTSRINRRLSFMPRVQSSGSVAVSVRGGTAFVSGSVRDSAQARAIERQLQLEPGVRRIVNQTQVRGF